MSWIYLVCYIRKNKDDPLQERCQDYSPTFPWGKVNFNAIETRFHLDKLEIDIIA